MKGRLQVTSRFLPALVLAALAQALPAPVVASQDAGAYLAARQARYASDFDAAAQYYTRALTSDPSNPQLLENALIAQLAMGEIDRAVAIARKMEADGLRSQISHVALLAAAAGKGRFGEMLDRLGDDRGMGPLGDGILTGWAHLGAGDMTAALDTFDAVAGNNGLRSFALYHKALALASVGDFEGADAVFSGESDGPLQRTRRGVIAWVQVLSQLEQTDRALALIKDTFGSDPDPQAQALRDTLRAGARVPFTQIADATDGVAETFYSLGRALMSENNEDYILIYARVAEYLKPGHIDGIMMTAGLLESLERYDLAAAAYRRVPADHPAFHNAELGRADTLRRADRTDAAREVLNALTDAHPDRPAAFSALGDLNRQLEDYAAAVTAYDRAIALHTARDTDRWFLYYARAISHERLGQWDRAEADFRHALDLNPDHPQVLNYLGYAMVEKNINLEEALGMIERAVAARPDSGYIVDSLGWVLYRVGRYDEAVEHMERAAELMPTDPVVNNHLGDVLWAVGRRIEARFQWRRALSLLGDRKVPPDIDPDRVRRKLDTGLDAVLAEEGAPPLTIADDNG